MGVDQIVAERFIQTPVLNVQKNAQKLGFTQRVEFPEQNVIKYYKDINDTGNFKSYFSRRCAKENGILVMADNPSIAQVPT